jgi:Acetoacetate decarboxylase (ADC)
MGIPRRIQAMTGRHSLVDGIPFQLPVTCIPSPVLMAVYPINPDRAKALMPAEVHPLRFGGKGFLVFTVINYLGTNIGTYVEYSIGIACTHGLKPAPPLLPLLLMGRYGTGQFVIDLPVSTQVSVKGGKGIWGMPKHQGNLDFKTTERRASSQYDLDGRLVTYIEIERPASTPLPLNMGAANYCAFRGMLMKSSIYMKGRAGMRLFGAARARLVIGDHPRAAPLKTLEIGPKPIATAYIPGAVGTLDDRIESWFLHDATPPSAPPEGMESVIDLPLDETWPPAPSAPLQGLTLSNL